MNKVTIEGTEYNVVPAPRRTCDTVEARCDFYYRDDKFCDDAPCRNPAVIFLTDANYVKHFITPRLTK